MMGFMVKRTVLTHPWLHLLALLSVALFPYGWLANHSTAFAWLVDLVFHTELAHTIGHFSLFALLGAALLLALPRLRRRPRLFLALILLFGIAQEMLQLLTFKHRFVTWVDVYDLAVDLLGASVTFVYWRKLSR